MSPHYYLLAQTADDLLVIGIRGVDTCLHRTAAQVLAEPRIMAGLSAADQKIVAAIAGMAENHPEQRRAKRKRAKDCI